MTGVATAVSIASFATSINKAVELTKTLMGLAKQGANLELQEKVMELRQAVLDAKDEALASRQEIQDLKSQLDAKARWAERAAAYALIKAPGGATVRHTAGPPDHYACPICFEAHRLSPLQDIGNYAGTYACRVPECKAEFAVDRAQNTAGGPITSDYSPWERG